MHASKLGMSVAILATAVGFSALAGTAQAQISGTIGGDVVDHNTLQVYGNSDISFIDGNVAFKWTHGKMSTRLTGTLHLKDADKARWRVRVDSLDRSGNLIDSVYDKLDGTPVKKEVKDIEVDVNATSAPYVDGVFVAVEMQGAGPEFVTKAGNGSFLHLHDDYVTITSDGLDVGGPGFVLGGGPLTPATISYAIGDDGKMTATYSGIEYWEQASCGRVVLRSMSPMGVQFGEVKGPKHCQRTNDSYHESQTFSTAPTADANSVEVAMQNDVGGWGDVGTETVSIAE